MFLVQREGVELGEGYEQVKKVLDKEGIDGYFKNGKLYVSKRDARDAKNHLSLRIRIKNKITTNGKN